MKIDWEFELISEIGLSFQDRCVQCLFLQFIVSLFKLDTVLAGLMHVELAKCVNKQLPQFAEIDSFICS